ncbi:MAG: putative transposase, partial [Paraglaciecola sp.]
EWLLNVFAYHAKYNTNNRTYQFWVQNNRPIELVSNSWIRQKLQYIRQSSESRMGERSRTLFVQ